jgi:two-component system chemotaxis sensor kinase CheA
MNPSLPSHTFLQEAEDLLAQIEAITLELRPGEAPGESINSLFRAFHTIKGSGAMFGFDQVAAFTHHVETVLDRVREGALAISEELLNLVLAAKDQIKALLDSAKAGDATCLDQGEKLVQALNRLLGSRDQAVGQAICCAPSAQPDASKPQTFRIRFVPPRGLMTSGTNPLLLLNELRGLGECSVKADPQGVPELGKLDPERLYLAWEIELSTPRGLNAIKDVFIFVEEDSQISIEEIPSPKRESASENRPAPERTVPQLPEPQQAGLRNTAAPVVQKAVLSRRPGSSDATVRVSSERLDRLVALVGEMVMNQSQLSQVSVSTGDSSISAPVEELERLVADLRDTVLGIRMMPIGTTFSRYKRLVHDLSADLGKEIHMVTEGAETELDKTVLDQLADPLVHLIRNSIDHGIEAAAERQSIGKAGQGTIRLSAAHIGSNVVISIHDDGRGLDVETIRAKAIEKHLISPDTKLSKEEIFDLIFLPGFSTARQVTSVSGRGVGMDVVRRQIDALRGSIQLTSEKGLGTTVALTLPLTLAIIDGLLVQVGDTQFIIPMSAVAETVELPNADRSRKNGRNLIAVRGELISYLGLREGFAINGIAPDPEKVVIVRHGTERVGLVVDRVLGSYQTVIQSLGRFYRQIEILSGATIMGDGRVALILDLGGLLRWSNRCHAAGDAQLSTSAP